MIPYFFYILAERKQIKKEKTKRKLFKLSIDLFSYVQYTLKEENFADFTVFAKIRKIKFPQKFSKSGVLKIKLPQNFPKLGIREIKSY